MIECSHPVATASGSDFTEYPGKQDFLQLAAIGGSLTYLPVTSRLILQSSLSDAPGSI